MRRGLSVLLMALLVLGVMPLAMAEQAPTFTVWIDADSDPNDYVIVQRAEEATGVHINWVTIPTDSITERVNLMWASGDYPDALLGALVKAGDAQKYGEQGLVLRLNDYITDDIMPNYAKYAREYLPLFTFPDGSIYYLSSIFPFYVTQNGADINREWLDKLGLDMPDTPEAFAEVLRAFRTGDPNGDGLANEIPFTVRPNPAALDVMGIMFGAFGYPWGLQVEDGTVIDPALTDEMKEAIKYFRGLYEEGLIDPEIFTQDETAYLAKGRSVPSIYGVSLHWRSGHSLGDDNSLAYELMPPLAGADGAQKWIGAATDVNIVPNALVTTACKDPETLLGWIDHFMDPAVGMEVRLGPLDYTLVYHEDTDSYEKIVPEGFSTLGEWLVGRHHQYIPHLIDQATWAKLDVPLSDQQKIDQDTMYIPFMVEAMPNYMKTSEETEALSLITTDLEKYIDETVCRWISGQGDVDAEWDAYVSRAKALGFDEYMAIYQGIYDRMN